MPLLNLEDNTQEVAQMLKQFGGDVMPAGQSSMFETARRIADRMSKPGSPIFYPVRWDSPKQMRAFFATNGFGGGIPTIRADSIPTGWEVNQSANGCEISNNQPGALAVYGSLTDRQSLIHIDRWPPFKEVADDELDKLNERAERALMNAAAKDGLEMT